ncbi:ShlB/FhaC/HecB family hemolysin secretion/activation protein [Herbaspirillum rubrisubalbicans]|uniref:ShlB/FhaC/HecB family hemolysin secretion/activation protein n=1 Tax=Herbaspirillum rubrisubalbicans TaxID=80842 RepID=UPI0012F64466|nr:ShlB/FhaC/HecB family hemolysin secretion/activation protein [Herbaspirillum rubrisubalbicans]
MLGLPLVCALAQAQTAVNQEQLQRERERALRQQQESRPDVNLGTPAPNAVQQAFPEHEQPCRVISAITLEGDQAERFRFALDSVTGPQGAVGRCLGSQGVNLVLAKVESAIVERGYTTTRVLARAQDLSTGQLRLTVVPGRVRHIRFAADADARGTAFNALPISPGDILNLRDVEQGLENFKRVPTAQADIKITPSEDEGAQPGDSDLVIQYQQAFPFRLSATLDDGGARSTGKYQVGLTLSYDNWWTLNDLFYVSVSRSLNHYGDHGSHAYTLHYSLPWGNWMAGVTLSGNRYHQTVSGAFENFVYSGRSETTEFKLSRLLRRDAAGKTTVFAKGLVRTAYNAIDDQEVSAQQRRTTSWEAGVNQRQFLGEAIADATLAYRRSLDTQGSEPSTPFDLPQIATHYGLWLLDASLNAPFQLGGGKLRYSGTLRAQWNRGNLPPQDQFSIGGRYTVRGFDGELTLQAERGWFLRNELALALGESGQELFAGVDTGAVSGPTAQFLTGQRLSGAALGLRGSLFKLSYEMFLATPLSKPQGFNTAALTGGFNLQWTF